MSKECSKCVIRCLFCEYSKTCTMYGNKSRLKECGDNPCKLEDRHCESILDAFGLKTRKKIQITKGTYGVSKIPCIYVNMGMDRDVRVIELFEGTSGGYCKTVPELMGLIAPYVNSQEYDIEITGF